jgi:hypothetical protein
LCGAARLKFGEVKDGANKTQAVNAKGGQRTVRQKRALHSLHTLQGNRALAARADDHLPRPAERRGGGRPSGPVVTPMFRVRVGVRVRVRVRVRVGAERPSRRPYVRGKRAAWHMHLAQASASGLSLRRPGSAPDRAPGLPKGCP